MRKFIPLVLAAFACTALPAQSADLPKASAPPPPPLAFSWTGFYAGVTAGYAGDKFNYPLAVSGLIAFNANASVTSSGFLFGGTVGYNYQFANRMVVGLEADWSYSDIRGQISLNAGPLAITAGSKIKDIGTVRARLGYAWNRALVYVTGGFAWGNISSGLNAALGGLALAPSRNNSVSGWVAGAGIEYALTNALSFKTEYLYVDLGRATLLTANLGGAGGVFFNLGVKTTAHIVRAGLNYRFGAPAGPLPPETNSLGSVPLFSWTGFYIGAVAGYSGDKFSYPLAVTGALVLNGSASVTSGGPIFGATIGYNYHFSNNLVLGVEADWSYADVKGQIALNAGPLAITAGSKLKDFGTARLRVGYAWNRALIYATGGFAWGKVNSGLTATLGGFAIAPSRNNSVSGWVIGAGVEYALTRNVTFKTEYLYADLGKGTLLNVNIAGGPPNGVNVNLGVNTTKHIVRAGINYKFGGHAAPVTAKY